jgi:hypothetical protein
MTEKSLAVFPDCSMQQPKEQEEHQRCESKDKVNKRGKSTEGPPVTIFSDIFLPKKYYMF